MKSLDIKNFCKDGNGNLLAAIAILVFGLLSGIPYLNDFPTYIHAWAQADWYSIALGFYNNGYDLFHPETLIYNKQFPDIWCTAYGDTITSADMPLHEYVAALLMALFGTTAPWVFRTWTLLCSLTGLWFLFLLCHKITQSWLKALAVVILALTSPLYAYYFANFLPSAPAVALVMAGLWAYLEYWQRGKTKYWHISIALLTLATLTRTSQAVALVAVCCFEILRVLRKETSLWEKIPSVAAGATAIVGYLLWNAHLRAEHGSLFLNQLMPPRHWEDVQWVWKHICDDWCYTYFGQTQQWLMAITIAGFLLTLVFHKRNNTSTLNRRPLSITFLALIWTFGELMFVVAMWRQYAFHDYYFLDSLWLPVLFWITLALKYIPLPDNKVWQGVILLALVLISGICHNESKHTQQFRHSGYDMAHDCYRNYLGSDCWLDELGVDREARILSVASYPQNTPFLLMGRKGYSIMWFGSDADVSVIARNARQFPLDYIVMENYLIPEHFEQYGEILRYTLPMADNGRLTLGLLSDTVVNNSADDFFAHLRQGSCN